MLARRPKATPPPAKAPVEPPYLLARTLPALTDSERCSNVEVVWRHAVRVLDGEQADAAERVADAWGIAALHHHGDHTVQGLLMEGRARQLADRFARVREGFVEDEVERFAAVEPDEPEENEDDIEPEGLSYLYRRRQEHYDQESHPPELSPGEAGHLSLR